MAHRIPSHRSGLLLVIFHEKDTPRKRPMSERRNVTRVRKKKNVVRLKRAVTNVGRSVSTVSSPMKKTKPMSKASTASV